MSLINQMLQDLDARRAAHGVGANLPNDVRPLPVLRPSRWPWISGVVVLGLLAGGVALYQRGAVTGAASVPAVAVVPRTVVSETAPVLSTPVQEKTVLPAPQTTEPSPAPETPLQELGGSLRMADVINLPIGKKTAVQQPLAPVVPEKSLPVEKKTLPGRDKPEANEKTLPASLERSPQEASKAGKPAAIERNDAIGTPRERAEAEYRKAIASVNQGRIAEALDSLRTVLKQEVYHDASRQLLVKLLLEAKRMDEAMQVLQEGLQSQPAQIGWAISLARLQVDRGDLAGAWQTLNYSSPVAGNNADYQGFSAHVLQRLGRNKDAAAHYQAAARLSPGDGRWWLGLGLVLEAEGQSSEAREAFLRARQCNNLSAELVALVEQKLR